MTLAYAVGDRVILVWAERNLLGTITRVTQWGRGGMIVYYRIKTIRGLVTAQARDLVPADNVIMLRHSLDTAPSEMDVPA